MASVVTAISCSPITAKQLAAVSSLSAGKDVHSFASSSSLCKDMCQKQSRSMSATAMAKDLYCNKEMQVVSSDSPGWGGSAIGRREAVLSGMMMALVGEITPPAFADFDEDYKNETQAVIERVKSTLALEKTDPTKADAVAGLRQTSNDWVAKYRREKSVAGKPSFSNMYSVLNAISGHYISFGPTYPIPAKRKDRILEEIRDAEKALKRGR